MAHKPPAQIVELDWWEDIEVGGNIEGNVTTVSGDVEARKIIGFTKTVSGDIIT